MNIKKIISITTSVVLVTSIALTTFAQNKTSNVNYIVNNAPNVMIPIVFGKVTALNVDTITVNGHQGFGSTTATVKYSVDATKAIVKKYNSTSKVADKVSDIVVGDEILVQGKVTGTNVLATRIFDGVIFNQSRASSTLPFVNNGGSIMSGTVATVGSTSFTFTTPNSSSTTYTVDVSNAKILKGLSTTTLSNILVGDRLLVQGKISGTSITATNIIDEPIRHAIMNASTTTPNQEHPGFFESIKQFFVHLFRI